MTGPLPASELLALFGHFLSLSLFATGGVMALASDMHRYVVDEHRYINHTQFVGSIALGQAAPGPNLMWVVVMGWLISGLPGALATTLGLALPALVFPVLVSRASRLPQFDRGLKALQRGLGPVCSRHSCTSGRKPREGGASLGATLAGWADWAYSRFSTR